MVPAMVQVQIPRFGGPEMLRTVELPSPPVGPGEVRIKVSAAGVNFADVQMRMGLYPEAPHTPFVPGFEVAGVVAETGPQVRSFRRGQRVFAACRFGGYATEIVLPAAQIRATPRKLSDREAAAIPIAFATAWVALMDIGRVREGDTVLIPGAAGGVGSAMVQVAARAGAEVVAVVGSAGKKEKVKALGASSALTYEELDSRQGGRGFSLVLEPRGGPYVRDSIRRLAPGGRVVCYGVSSIVAGARRSIPYVMRRMLQTPLLTPIGLQMTNRGVHGLNMLKLFDSREGLRILLNAFDQVLEGVQAGLFKPVVSRVFPLASASAAHEFIQSRKSVGKVILICLE
jgi:NADPH:quinone reductase-like Zn-dependent oxidoreductase